MLDTFYDESFQTANVTRSESEASLEPKEQNTLFDEVNDFGTFSLSSEYKTQMETSKGDNLEEFFMSPNDEVALEDPVPVESFWATGFSNVHSASWVTIPGPEETPELDFDSYLVSNQYLDINFQPLATLPTKHPDGVVPTPSLNIERFDLTGIRYIRSSKGNRNSRFEPKSVGIE